MLPKIVESHILYVRLMVMLQDLEKGAFYSDVVLSSSICSRPTSSSCTSTSAEGKVAIEDKLRSEPNVGSVEVEVEVAPNNEPIGT